MPKPEITFKLRVEQDDTPVRSNAMASGDDAADKAYENRILRRLDAGDVWAWAWVEVTAECEGFTGSDGLGGCTYKDEADFRRPGGYYDDMKRVALDNLRAALKDAVERGNKASALLVRLEKVELPRCTGRMRNGPDKRYARCTKCGAIDHELNEGDRCRALAPDKKAKG